MKDANKRLLGEELLNNYNKNELKLIVLPALK